MEIQVPRPGAFGSLATLPDRTEAGLYDNPGAVGSCPLLMACAFVENGDQSAKCPEACHMEPDPSSIYLPSKGQAQTWSYVDVGYLSFGE